MPPKKKVLQTLTATFSEPTENQSIVQIKETRGGGLYLTDNDLLVKLPTKFHKVIWVKRKTYVIIELYKEKTTKVDGDIVSALFPDDIKYLRSKNMWPDKYHVKEVEEEDEDEYLRNSNHLESSDDESQ
ncbi:hypothetical protein EDD86DRAFT_203120 [Gorgonomyces haynaldii]|nr:hypothetical protein EDD86DRAFT_203120 [Gorgonomyces haynaldii]